MPGLRYWRFSYNVIYGGYTMIVCTMIDFQDVILLFDWLVEASERRRRALRSNRFF